MILLIYGTHRLVKRYILLQVRKMSIYDVNLWELEHADSVTRVTFNVDGKFVATGSMDGHVYVSAVESGELVLDLESSEITVHFLFHLMPYSYL